MVTKQAFEYACQRVQDFATVQQPRELEEKLGALEVMLESLGVDEDIKSIFTDWLEGFVGPGWDGAIWLGLLIGLYIHQYETEDV